MKLLDRFRNVRREMRDVGRFFEGDAASRAITFYSEKGVYYRYFEGFLRALTETHGKDVAYLTSDPDDRLFGAPPPRIHPFFVNKLLPAAFRKLDGKALVMTVPDLHQFHLKRAPDPVRHVYAFHAMVSTHLQYGKGAYDFYDAMLCVGPYHVEELRRAEKIYSLKPKTLIECGYPFLEKVYKEHEEYLARRQPGGKKKVLIAPTWGEVCILNSCIYELLGALTRTGEYEVIVRPHPEFIKREPQKALALARKVQETPGTSFEENLLSTKSLHEADILITDQSGIAFEYALGTERPVLFIDTPLKVMNPAYKELGIEPIEVTLRSRLGVRIPIEQVRNAARYLEELGERKNEFRKDMRAIRETHVFNWMRSGEVGAAYVKEQAV